MCGIIGIAGVPDAARVTYLGLYSLQHRGQESAGAVVVDGARNITYAEEGTIAILGLSDLIVVRSGDAVLVAQRKDAQEVRRIVERLAASGRSGLL